MEQYGFAGGIYVQVCGVAGAGWASCLHCGGGVGEPDNWRRQILLVSAAKALFSQLALHASPHLCPVRYRSGVQEPDTAASAAQALISLVAAEERYFPLGFAYGHIRDAAVSVHHALGLQFVHLCRRLSAACLWHVVRVAHFQRFCGCCNLAGQRGRPGGARLCQPGDSGGASSPG